MNRRLEERQQAVNTDPRPRRTPDGDLFTTVIVALARLGGRITTIGEQLAADAGTTLARWVVLDRAMDEPATVAQIAKGRGMARQSVQRIADLLVADGLAEYQDNPDHKRARLLRPTAAGRDIVATIGATQKIWADRNGARLGAANLREAQELIERIQALLIDPSKP